LENPPLWVWAIIVGAIIASKFIYRWQSTKYFAKEAEEKSSSSRINPNNDKTKDIQNNNFYGIVNRRYSANTGAHKYSLRRYYKDYFAIKKRKE
jgi:hypothetical protein